MSNISVKFNVGDRVYLKPNLYLDDISSENKKEIFLYILKYIRSYVVKSIVITQTNGVLKIFYKDNDNSREEKDLFASEAEAYAASISELKDSLQENLNKVKSLIQESKDFEVYKKSLEK